MKDYLIFQEMEDNLKSSENISNLNYQLMPNIASEIDDKVNLAQL